VWRKEEEKKKGPFGQNSFEFRKFQKYQEGGSDGLLKWVL
jgi:hypothetical protein